MQLVGRPETNDQNHEKNCDSEQTNADIPPTSLALVIRTIFVPELDWDRSVGLAKGHIPIPLLGSSHTFRDEATQTWTPRRAFKQSNIQLAWKREAAERLPSQSPDESCIGFRGSIATFGLCG